MSFLSAIYTLLIGPLNLFFEVVYSLAFRVLHNEGLSIIFLSLAMNFLVLPLYKKADQMQAEERDIEIKMNPWVSHIKKTFSGDERFMMLQTYYRQNNYKPTYALKGSLSLLLEIPFFIAAYKFLSGLEMLKGVSFGPISNLGAPDGILIISGVAINILPIIMTLLNFISGIIYTKGFPLKSKIQLYGMAIIFLVFLYNSPSGLVFYWTLNNLFSLLKNVFYGMKNPKLVLSAIFSVVSIGLIIFLIINPMDTIRRQIWVIALLIMLQAPICIYFYNKKVKKQKIRIDEQYSKHGFVMSGIVLSLMIGLLIPSAVIKSSPAEFIDITNYQTPIWYIVSSLLLAVGTFVLWLYVFYSLSDDSKKMYYNFFAWELIGLGLVDYLAFGNNLGNLSSALKYDDGVFFSLKEQFINVAVLLVVFLILYFIWKKKPDIYKFAYPVLMVAIIGMSIFNMVNIQSVASDTKEKIKNTSETSIKLYRNKNNVVVFMLDRAISSYIPYMFNENPELANQYEGFTYYPNTASFGMCTNIAVPAIYGGYEYTPSEMNKRDKELLKDKHNEALKVIPALFNNNNYKVSVWDPTYAGYEWIPDLSIYDDYENVDGYIVKGTIDPNKYSGDKVVKDTLYRNFFCYSIFRVSPLFCQTILYNDGLYNETDAIALKDKISEISDNDEMVISEQTRDGKSKATGVSKTFMNSYNTLLSLSNLTRTIDGNEVSYDGSFTLITNDITHDPMLLSEPDYSVSQNIDNTKYDKEHEKRYAADGSYINLSTEVQMIHYQSNMAALMQIGKWLDVLRENGVYDNTRIIIVSDHGKNLGQFRDLVVSDDKFDDLMYYNALLLVKDFDSKDFSVDESFHTNADTPYLAMNGLIKDMTNPFTGKKIQGYSGQEVKALCSHEWDVEKNNGYKFIDADWYYVIDDVRNPSNWVRKAN